MFRAARSVRGARAGRAELRCAYCHDARARLEAACACGTLLHPDCRAELTRCPTLGCGRSLPPRPVSAAGAVRAAGASLATALVEAAVALLVSAAGALLLGAMAVGILRTF
ncbi:MAG: hypothetical protein D6731_17970 [Planctomycetota bacterium]|nr:MAG: hypothetical protein D6731_17970 [Planctomycetota bacterium]